MKLYKTLSIKFIITMALCLGMACTFQVDIPPIKVVTAPPPVAKTYDMSKAYGSIAMVALQPVRIAKILGLGTAFAINNDTLLTAGHVCESIRKLTVNGVVAKKIFLVYLGRSDSLARRVGARIRNIDGPNDMCELELKNHGLEPLSMANYRAVKFNDKAYIVGAPSGVMASITEGTVMQKVSRGLGDPNANDKLVISSAATGGHSGSPILNYKGEVIGMLVRGHPTYDHLSFGVHGPMLKRFMRKYKIRFTSK